MPSFVNNNELRFRGSDTGNNIPTTGIVDEMLNENPSDLKSTHSKETFNNLCGKSEIRSFVKQSILPWNLAYSAG